MRRKGKNAIKNGFVLRKNEGSSIVLVTIISIIIVTGVIILRVTTSSLWASADKQYNQDQAYMAATSLGEAVDVILYEGAYPPNSIDGIPINLWILLL